MTPKNLKIVLTGQQGVGMTTIVHHVCQAFLRHGIELWGFTTMPLGLSGGSGYEVVTFSGYRVPFVHLNMARGLRIGPYRVDVPAFDSTAIPTLQKPVPSWDSYLDSSTNSIGIVHEVGQFQCCSAAFKSRIEELWYEPGILLMTVAEKGHGLIQDLKEWAGDELITVTEQNRTDVPKQIFQQFKTALR